VLAIVEVVDETGASERYLVPFLIGPGSSPAREAHEGDGAWRALGVAIAAGHVPRTEAGGALVCRPGLALAAFAPGGAPEVARWSERSLGADQSNSSVVLGERLLLKAYRRVAPGLNPDLELTAYLAEERGLRLVPALAGSAEYVAPDGSVATLAMLQELVPDAKDAYETTAERLADWIAAPGSVALEYATEDAAELGATLAELHAALADAGELTDFTPRAATRHDLRDWRLHAEARLDAALRLLDGDAVRGPELRTWAPAIRDRLAALDTPTAPPLLTRVHGDLHLGQILRTPGGFVLVDFEGEPMRAIGDRRALGSPLRDVATLLRSFDHVSTSAERRAAIRIAEAGGRDEGHVGLDIDAWRRRSRERFLRAYRDGLRRARAPLVVDEPLIAALEVAKECDEYVYAATYLPSWLWAPHEGMRRLVGGSTGEGPR
jgi:trehalose synthase-fused probable maltokinase